jgi:uncharacterized membrane protein YgaE (UPF0421/DUF939 family)
LVDSSEAEASQTLFEVISAVDVLSDQIFTLRNLWAQDRVKRTEVDDMFWARELKRVVRPNSLRYSYALKYASTLALAVAVGFLVPFPLFKWTIWTIAFLVRPYAEDTSQRSRVRIESTFIGIVLFTALFAITDIHPVLLFCGIALQILSYLLPFNTYSQLTISTTATLVLVALATNETGFTLSLERAGFVILGAIVATAVTRFVFPYRVSVVSVDLVERSRHLSYLMLKKVLSNRLAYEKTDDFARINDEAKPIIKGTALAINIMEYQLRLNSQIREYEQINEFIRHQHALVGEIYFFFASFPHMPKDHKVIDRIMIKLLALITRIDDELVRVEGRNTRYGGPDFYALRYTYLEELDALQRRIDAAFAYVDDEDTRLSLNALGSIVEKLKVPFECEWIIDRLQ